jgi:hypothetical protein
VFDKEPSEGLIIADTVGDVVKMSDSEKFVPRESEKQSSGSMSASFVTIESNEVVSNRLSIVEKSIVSLTGSETCLPGLTSDSSISRGFICGSCIVQKLNKLSPRESLLP